MKKVNLRMSWRERSCSLEQCTGKVLTTLNVLGSVDASLRRWFLTTRVTGNTSNGHPDSIGGTNGLPLEITGESISLLLLRGARPHIAEDPGSEAGYALFLKSGEEHRYAHLLTIYCGASAKGTVNKVVVEFSRDEALEHLTEYAYLLAVYSKLVTIWSPQEGLINDPAVETPLLSEVYN